MENPKKEKQINPEIKEGTGYSRHDEKKHHKPVDDSFKTSDKEYSKQEWTEPLDEQQLDTFNEKDSQARE